MSARTSARLVIASVAAALALAGCSAGGGPAASTNASTGVASAAVASPTPATSVAQATSVTPDPVGLVLVDVATSVDATTTHTRLSAAQAIAKTSYAGLWRDSATLTVVVTKARLGGGAWSGHIVWLVGVAPIRLSSYGPGGGVTTGQTVFIVDANTGKVLGGADGAL